MVQIKKASKLYFPPLTPGLALSHLINVAISTVIIQAARGFQDATTAMAFYGVYHRTPINQLIHFFGVPLIIWSMAVFQAHVPLTSSVVLQGWGIPPHYPTWATLLIPFYIFYYLSIDVLGAILYTPIWYLFYSTAVRWTAQDQKAASSDPSWMGTGRVLRWAGLAHVLAWYIQIHPGHKIVEGAQPAVMQSLGGALFTAPLFAFYEGIWFIGLRKEFQQQVLALVDELTQKLCAEGASMRACATVG